MNECLSFQYTGVKLVDIYLSRVKGVPKTQLQLCGATALLIACKVDRQSMRLPSEVDTSGARGYLHIR